MNFVDAVKTCLAKYVDFKGRASRSEFWWFYLFVIIVYVICSIISPTLARISSLVFLLPFFAAFARRAHDTDRSGWWSLILFVPILNLVFLIWYGVSEGSKTPNQYGPPIVV